MTETKQVPRRRKFTDQCFVVNLLPDEFVLAEGVAGFSCDGINGSLLHLLLDGTVQHEQRLAGALLVREEAQGYQSYLKLRQTGIFLKLESFLDFLGKGNKIRNSGRKGKNMLEVNSLLEYLECPGIKGAKLVFNFVRLCLNHEVKR